MKEHGTASSITSSASMQTPLTQLKFLLRQFGSRSVRAFIDKHQNQPTTAETLFEKTLSQADFLNVVAAFLEADPTQPGTYHLSDDVLRVLSSPALLALVVTQSGTLNIDRLVRNLALLAPITPHAAELLVSRTGQTLMATGFSEALISADHHTCQVLSQEDPLLTLDQGFSEYLDTGTLLQSFKEGLGMLAYLKRTPANIFEQLHYDANHLEIQQLHGFFQFIHFFLSSVYVRQALLHHRFKIQPPTDLLNFYIKHKFQSDADHTAYANPLKHNPVLADKERFLRLAIEREVTITDDLLQSLSAHSATIPESAFQALENPQWVALINAQQLSLDTLFSNQWLFLQQLLAIEGVLKALQKDPTIWRHLHLVNQQVVITAFQNPALIALLQAQPQAWPWVLQLPGQPALNILDLANFYPYLNKHPASVAHVFGLLQYFASIRQALSESDTWPSSVLIAKERLLAMAITHDWVVTQAFVDDLKAFEGVISEHVFAVLDNPQLIKLLNSPPVESKNLSSNLKEPDSDDGGEIMALEDMDDDFAPRQPRARQQASFHLSLSQLLSQEACLGLQALALSRVKTWFNHVYQTLAPYLLKITDPNVLQALKNSDAKKPAPFDLIGFISVNGSPEAWQVILCGQNTWCYLEALLAIDQVRQKIIKKSALWPELAKVSSFAVVEAFQNPALIGFLEKNPTAWPWVLQLAHDEALPVLSLDGMYAYLDQRPHLWPSIFTLSNGFAAQALQIEAVRAWLNKAASNPEAEDSCDNGLEELRQVVAISNTHVVTVLRQEGIVDLITRDIGFRWRIFSRAEKIVADMLSIAALVALLQQLHTDNPSQFKMLAQLIFTSIKNPQAVEALSQTAVIDVLSQNFWVWKYIPRIQDEALVELFHNVEFLKDLKNCPHNLQNAFDHYDFAKAAYHYLTWDPKAPDNTRHAKAYRPTHTEDKVKEVAAFLKALQAKSQTVSKDQLKTWLKHLIHHRGEFRRYLEEYTVYSKDELKALTFEKLIPLFRLLHTAPVHQFVYLGKGRSDSIVSVSSEASRHDASGRKGVRLTTLGQTSETSRLNTIAEEETVEALSSSSSSLVNNEVVDSALASVASGGTSGTPMVGPSPTVEISIKSTTTLSYVDQTLRPSNPPFSHPDNGSLAL